MRVNCLSAKTVCGSQFQCHDTAIDSEAIGLPSVGGVTLEVVYRHRPDLALGVAVGRTVGAGRHDAVGDGDDAHQKDKIAGEIVGQARSDGAGVPPGEWIPWSSPEFDEVSVIGFLCPRATSTRIGRRGVSTESGVGSLGPSPPSFP
jgi:hypothetical protein